MDKYAGKKVVVTGGTHGIGFATVKALVEGGAEVLLTGQNKQNLEAARHELGSGVHVVRSDTASMTDIDALGSLVEEKFGQVDFVFINAGVGHSALLEQVTEVAYDRTFNINTKGAYFTVQRLARLVRNGGSVVFTTAISHEMGIPDLNVYSASKAALRSFTRGLAAEFLTRQIRVNAVSPGFIKTMTMGVADAPAEVLVELEKMGKELTPMKRLGTPEEVARVVLFLAFDATFTTGIELPVDGGIAQSLSAY